MSWRLSRSEFNSGKTGANKRRLKRLVQSGKTPGILAYAGTVPIGWCSAAPREEFGFLARSRVLAPLDDRPVWSVSCMFIAKEYRRRGLSALLLRAAADFVRKRGGKILEGYPVIPYDDAMPAAFAWTGTVASFTSAGFEKAGGRSKARPIVRLKLS